MKAIISGWHTDIFPNDDEVKEHCKIGQGADTCSWLTMGSDGWHCFCLHRSAVASISERRKNGTMVAMRDGCDKVNNFKPWEHGMGTAEF